MAEERAFEYDGVVAVGDITVIGRRNRIAEENHEVAYQTGRREALAEVLAYAEDRLAAQGVYDDTRPLTELIGHLADMIRQ